VIVDVVSGESKDKILMNLRRHSTYVFVIREECAGCSTVCSLRILKSRDDKDRSSVSRIE